MAERQYDESLLTDAERAMLEKPLSEPDYYEPGTEPTEEEIKAMQRGQGLQTALMDPADARAAEFDATQRAEAARTAAALQAAAAAAAPVAPSADEIPPTVPPAPDVEGALAAIEAEAAALKTKLDDGEISEAEFASANRQLGAKQGRIEAEKDRHEQDYAAARQKADALWTAATTRLAEAAPDLLTPANLANFNAIVYDITQTTTGQTYDQMLATARNTFAARYNRPDLAATAAPRAPAPAPKPALPPEPVRVQPVPTLANLPSAAAEETGQGRWDAIDAMLERGDTEAYQAAIRRMTPAEKDAFGKYAR